MKRMEISRLASSADQGVRSAVRQNADYFRDVVLVPAHQDVRNGADGVEFSTLLNGALIFQGRKTSILRAAGAVSHARRGPIAARVRAALGPG